MIPLRPQNTTRVLATHQDEYKQLCIVDVKIEDGNNVMISIWEPTPKELEILNTGGKVCLGILGTTHPAVNVTVQE